MVKMTPSTLLRVLAAVAAMAIGAIVLIRATVRIPVQLRLADLTNASQTVSMTCRHLPGYQLVLGVPATQTGQLRFRGEVVFVQRTKEILRLSVGSHDITPCNWLPTNSGLQGYVLTWESTNRDILEHSLRRDESYNMKMTFSEMPPAGSSLWLSAFARPRLW